MKKIIEGLSNIGLKAEAESLEILAIRQGELHYKLPVMGGMKAGKSTMLARLLNVDDTFFPKDMVEATARNINVTYGPLAFRTYTAPEGNEIAVDDDEQWNDLVCGTSSIPFSRLDIAVPDDLLEKNSLDFVDTPGNNTVDEAKATETWKALIDSQAGIYCLKATALIEQSDLAFIQEARYYVNNFIFVITRLDELHAKSIHSDIADKLVENARKRLSELNIEPLAILPISAMAPNLEDTGLLELRQTIQDLIISKGQDLKQAQIRHESRRILEKTQQTLKNELEIAQKGLQVSADDYAAQQGALEARLLELKSDKDSALHQLTGKIDALKHESRKKVTRFSEATLARIEERLGNLQKYADINTTGDSIVRSEIDKWRQDVTEFVNSLPQLVASLQINASEDFVEKLKGSIAETMNVNLDVSVAEINDDHTNQTYMDDYLDNLNSQQEQLLKQIAEIQDDLSKSGEHIPELEQKLQEAQQAVQSLHYEPVYTPVEKRPSGKKSSFLKMVGGVLDIGMIFMPIGWLTGLGKIGVASRHLPKLTKIIKNGQKFDKTIKTPGKVPPSPTQRCTTPLEMLSFEYWGEKIGTMLDHTQEQPTSGDMEENQEVYQAYINEKNALESQCNQAQCDLKHWESRLEEKETILKTLKKQNQELTQEFDRAQEEALKLKAEAKQAKEKTALLGWRKDILNKINFLLYSSKSELLAPVKEALDNFFGDCTVKAVAELDARLEETISKVKEQFAESQMLHGQNSNDIETSMNHLREQLQFVNSILTENLS